MRFHPGCAFDFDDPPLDDMGRFTLDQAIDQAGSPHKADLTDGKGQQRVFILPIQIAPGVHQAFDTV